MGKYNTERKHKEGQEMYKAVYHFMRYKEFADFPKYKQSYIRAFERMLDARKEKGLETQWETGEDVFRRWSR